MLQVLHIAQVQNYSLTYHIPLILGMPAFDYGRQQ